MKKSTQSKEMAESYLKTDEMDFEIGFDFCLGEFELTNEELEDLEELFGEL